MNKLTKINYSAVRLTHTKHLIDYRILIDCVTAEDKEQKILETDTIS